MTPEKCNSCPIQKAYWKLIAEVDQEIGSGNLGRTLTALTRKDFNNYLAMLSNSTQTDSFAPELRVIRLQEQCEDGPQRKFMGLGKVTCSSLLDFQSED